MDALYCLRDMLCTELDNVVANSQGNIPLDVVDKITHSLKSIETIIAMKEGIIIIITITITITTTIIPILMVAIVTATIAMAVIDRLLMLTQVVTII